jgi:hypothetical protein
MRRDKTKAGLLLLAGLLALGLLTVAWAIGPGSSEAEQGAMHNCPQPGKWAISVWDGPDGTETGQALDTCGEGAVAAAYYLDPQTQGWSRWFAGQPQMTTLATLNNVQGVIALGAMGAPPPSPTPTPTLGAVSAKEGYALALQVARAKHPDAYLTGVESGCHTAGGFVNICYESEYYRMASGDGRSTYWHFSFYPPGAPANEAGFMVDVVQGQPDEGYTFGTGSGSFEPLLFDEVIDSTEAVSIADAHGGSAYRAATPGSQVSGACISGGSMPAWQIDYCPPFDEGGPGLVVWVDAITGEVIETEQSEWG